MKDRPIEDLLLAEDFRHKLLERADRWDGPVPLWYGWAIFDAFLAGLDHARAFPSPASVRRNANLYADLTTDF